MADILPDAPLSRARAAGRLLVVNAALLAAVLAIAEVALRAFETPQAIPYTVHPPDTSVTVTVDPHVTFGVRGDALFETNALGLRGPMPHPHDDVRIVALGGSTTECFVLSLEESWPWRLGRLLSDRGGKQVWVGNAGRAGRNSRQHYFDARYVLPELKGVDAVLLMVGINDVFHRMTQGQTFDRVDVAALDEGGEYIRSALEVRAPVEGWMAGLRLAQRGRKALEALALIDPRQREIRHTLNHALPDFYVWAREMRAAGSPLDVPPPLDEPLAEFERNLSLTLGLIEKQGAVPVLITQPAMWREDLTERERAALWLGSADGWPPRAEGGPYYTIPVMARMLDRYNGLLGELAARRGVALIDLAARLRAGLDTCYDDVHFNEEGSRLVAEILAESLISSGVLGQ